MGGAVAVGTDFRMALCRSLWGNGVGADALGRAVETRESVAEVGYHWSLLLPTQCVVDSVAIYSDVWINCCCQYQLGSQLVWNRLSLPKVEHQQL